MKVGKGKKSIYFKKAPVDSSLVQRCGQPTAVIVPVEQSYDTLQSSRKSALNGSWCRKFGGRLDVTFADEIFEVNETQTTCITDKLCYFINFAQALQRKL